jgi:hypothetical protein
MRRRGEQHVKVSVNGSVAYLLMEEVYIDATHTQRQLKVHVEHCLEAPCFGSLRLKNHGHPSIGIYDQLV